MHFPCYKISHQFHHHKIYNQKLKHPGDLLCHTMMGAIKITWKSRKNELDQWKKSNYPGSRTVKDKAYNIFLVHRKWLVEVSLNIIVETPNTIENLQCSNSLVGVLQCILLAYLSSSHSIRKFESHLNYLKVCEVPSRQGVCQKVISVEKI